MGACAKLLRRVRYHKLQLSGAAAVLAPLELAHACICERRGRQSESESESQRNRERERERERDVYFLLPLFPRWPFVCVLVLSLFASPTPPPPPFSKAGHLARGLGSRLPQVSSRIYLKSCTGSETVQGGSLRVFRWQGFVRFDVGFHWVW